MIPFNTSHITEFKVPKTNLEEVYPYKYRDRWYLKLEYTYDAPDGKHRIRIPMCELPIFENYVSIFENSESHTHLLIKDYTYLHKGSIVDKDGTMHNHVYFIDEVIKPAIKEMTLEEIEKQLGHKVKIVNA